MGCDAAQPTDDELRKVRRWKSILEDDMFSDALKIKRTLIEFTVGEVAYRGLLLTTGLCVLHAKRGAPAVDDFQIIRGGQLSLACNDDQPAGETAEIKIRGGRFAETALAANISTECLQRYQGWVTRTHGQPGGEVTNSS